MVLVVIGALLVIGGVAVAAVRTAGRGRLSQPTQTSAPLNTLEPTGKGRRLSLKADLLGLGLVALGVIFILAGALA